MLAEKKEEDSVTHDFNALVDDFIERAYLTPEKAGRIKQFTREKKAQFFSDVSNRSIKRLIAQGVLPVKQLFYFFEQSVWPCLKNPIVASLIVKGWLTIGQAQVSPHAVKRFPLYASACACLSDEVIQGLMHDGFLTEDQFLQSNKWAETVNHLTCAEGMVRRHQITADHVIRYGDVIMQKGGYPALQHYLTCKPMQALLAGKHVRAVDVIRYPYETWNVLIACVEKHRVPLDEVRQLLPLIQHLLNYRDELFLALQRQLFSYHVCKWRFPLQEKLDATHSLLAVVKGECSFGELEGMNKKVLACARGDVSAHCRLLEAFLSETRASYTGDSPDSVALLPVRRAAL